ncbi:hypothetical protein GGQ84_002673 [Desulfitispora alkaliphila]
MTIMCSINNCHYWSQGNVCKANKIFVASDEVGESAPESFDAMQASTAEPTPVQNCASSCCKTFVEKNGNVQADGVYKKNN